MKKLDNRFHLFDHIIQAHFLSRPNRFLIRCKWNDRAISAFLPNPGRLQELFIPGRLVYLVREEESRRRKTLFTAVAVDRDGQPIMLHTLRTNEVARYLLQKGKIPGLERPELLNQKSRREETVLIFSLKKGTRTFF